MNRLGPLFDPHAVPAHLDEHRYFGWFMLNGDASVGEVAAMYGLAALEAAAESTLHEYFSRRLHGRAGIGDSVALGAAKLVVSETVDGKVTRVRVRLPQP